MRGKIGAAALRSKGREMAADRITPHESKCAAVLSPAAFLQGWTSALARQSWMGVQGLLHCAIERLGAQPCQGNSGGSAAGIFLGGSGIPSQHRKAACTCIQALVFLANLGRKA